MIELNVLRKNKINLADYNSQQDIDNRILLSDFSLFDVSVLEEILFSPLKTSVKKIIRALGSEEEKALPILMKLEKAGLLTLQGDSILVDKEIRKYFEFQIQRFNPDFKPDMEFLQGLLRKIPIHTLPVWYSIPRSSNNIFDSIIDKYLLTPQIFQRYLSDLHFTDPAIGGILRDLFAAPHFCLSSSDVISKYNLSRRDFEEICLTLEYHFVCTVSYVKGLSKNKMKYFDSAPEEEDHWHEILTPFYEWHQYLLFLRQTDALIIKEEDVLRRRDRDFAFIEDATAILTSLQKKPCSDDPSAVLSFSLLCNVPLQTPEDLAFATQYFNHMIDKLCLLKLAARVDHKLYALDSANDWLYLSLENRALYLYRHPLNRILTAEIQADTSIERNVREAEKSIRRVLHGQWVLFDDFLRGVIAPFNESSVVMLKKIGKQWKYTLPSYSDTEKELIRASVFELLFEYGIVSTGSFHGRDCFCVTPFGRSFFEE